jgi:1-acyl-sn-glycerol-3-phosphate acyltransferase
MLLFSIRLILIILWIAISCLLGILVGILRPFDPRNIKIVSRLLNVGRHILGIHIEIKNREILESSRPCIFISNHQDNLDIFPGAFSIPENTVTLGKRSILLIPFFGLFYWLSGNILINRKNKKSAFETMDVASKAIQEKKISIWIMPEGTRSRGRGVLPFKKGPFITAIKAQVPIVPVAISSYTKKINFKKWKAGTILIEVLPAITTANLGPMDAGELKDQAFKIISTCVKKLDELVENTHE